MTIHHPDFCDPRSCAPLGDASTDHRSTPMSFLAAGYLTVSVGLSSIENASLPELGWTGIVLQLIDDGIGRTTSCDLSAIDARLLAALLVQEAERVEALAAVTR